MITHKLQNYYMQDKRKLWHFLRNSSHLTFYKIIRCVGQEETVAFLKEFLTFNIPQNYYMCRTRGNSSIFEGIHQIIHTTKLLHM